MRPQAKRSSAVNHDGSASRGSVFGRITAAIRVSSPESEGSGAPSHARAFDFLAPARLALIALAVAGALLFTLLLAGSARAAYTAGTPLSVTNTVAGVAVNQSSREVYASSLGQPLSSVPGQLARFDSSGTNLGCTLPVSVGAAGVAVNPVTNNIYLGDIFFFGLSYQVHTFRGDCASRVGTEFPISAAPADPIPQPATDAAGALYLPNEADGTVKKFQPNGTEVTLTNPITGLANPSSVALDATGNIYVAETGAAGVNEVQTVTFTSFVGGDTFTLGNLPPACTASTTAPITYATGTAGGTAIDTALEAACGGVNDFLMAGSSTNRTVSFQGQFAATDVPLLSCAKVAGGGSCSTRLTSDAAPAKPARVSRFAPDGTPAGTLANANGTSSVTVNKTTSEVFVGVGLGSTFHIEKYNSAGTKIDDFGSGLFRDRDPNLGLGLYNHLAVDETSGTVYATDAGDSQVEVLLPLRRLSVVKSGTGTGRVTSNVGGIDCGSTCSADFSDGDTPTLTATADPGSSVFTGWSGGGCSGSARTCQVTIAGSDVEVTANFVPARRLTVTTVGQGRVSGSSGTIANCTSAGGANCSGSYQEASSVTLTATPDAHNRFSGWSGADVGSCDQTGATLTCPVTIPNHDAAITATFAPITRTLTVTPVGSGRVDASSGAIANCNSGGGTCAGTYNQNSVVTLTATPNANQKFSGWSGADVGSCDRTGATLTCPVTIPAANAAITATFVLNDTDGDGVPDGSDACPSQAASTANGCPAPVVDPPPATCATNPSLCPPPEDKLGPCVKQANAAYKKALKAAKKKSGKARAKAIKAAKKKKSKSVSRCKASFSRSSL